jgi:hypothetical protein
MRKIRELIEKYFQIKTHSNTIHLHSKNPRKAEKIIGKNPMSIGPQTLLESFYFQIHGSLENLSQILVL